MYVQYAVPAEVDAFIKNYHAEEDVVFWPDIDRPVMLRDHRIKWAG